jgi:hypothetical protein
VDRAAGRPDVELGRRRRGGPGHKMRGRARLQRGDSGHELDYGMRGGATEAPGLHRQRSPDGGDTG